MNISTFTEDFFQVQPSLQAIFFASYFEFTNKPLVVVLPKSSQALSLYSNLTPFVSKEKLFYYPSTENLPFENMSPLVSTMGERQKTRINLANNTNGIYICSTHSAVSKVSQLPSNPILKLSKTQNINRASLQEQFVNLGYERQYQVEAKGEFSIRGEVVDIYPSTFDHPVRLTFFDDELEKISLFNVANQKSYKQIDNIEIFGCKEIFITEEVQKLAKKFITEKAWAENVVNGIHGDGMESFLPWITKNPKSFLDEIKDYPINLIYVDKNLIENVYKNLTEEESHLKEDLKLSLKGSFYHEGIFYDGKIVSSFIEDTGATVLKGRSVGSLVLEDDLVNNIKRWKENNSQIFLASDNKKIANNLIDHIHSIDETLPIKIIPNTADVEIEDLNIVIVNEQNFTKHKISKKVSQNDSKRNTSYEDLSAGNYVVHSVHGIGKFLGIETKEFMGVEKEYLSIAFKGSDKLYVPTDQLHLVRKYSGSDSPTLNKMGGSDFAQTKAKVKRETNHIAQQLVQLYRIRHETEGFAFSPDTPWQQELEDSFEYELTADQAKSLQEIKFDMESSIPMDRLLCGDVGFGKTEVAIRAAFKATQDNKQVIVLAPTTLLAHQHCDTFNSRLSTFPVKVEVLTRFVSASKQKQVIEAFNNGSVDILIGTHRLLSSDIKPKDCGLLIIDEEQRFGVDHKEHLKQLTNNIDVLSLSATPIPRTLEMSITGIREISVINTPPTNRLPILTSVVGYNEKIISEAIRRELLREGQVFFLHNKVQDIELVRDKIADLVPNARVDFAHGQMGEHKLENAISKVWERETDVLVATTIIESGLDLPFVNTLIVNNAHKLGLAQLYQLRGRVGRRGQRAYAYMFYPNNSNRKDILTDQAFERLKTIGDFTELGSGYQIAMKDLEIRGAGSLLGQSQSGHIASVGFDIYCQMVKESVDALKGIVEKPITETNIDIRVSALIPESYIERQDLKLEAYKKIASVEKTEEINEIYDELIDRYGEPPIEVVNLIKIAKVKVFIQSLDCSSLSIMNNKIILVGKNIKESTKARIKRLYPKSIIKNDEVQIVGHLFRKNLELDLTLEILSTLLV